MKALLACLALSSAAQAAVPGPAPDELLLATPERLLRLKTHGPAQQSALPPTLQTPLGSTWKLFVYLYLAEQEQTPADYTCEGSDPEEAFCCRPGERIGMDRALAQSCGLYFAPQRLGLDAGAWRRFWQKQAPGEPWLADLPRLKAARVVPVTQLLAAVQAAPTAAARRASAALTRVTLDGRGAGAVQYFGSQVRVKTWTWDHPTRVGEKMGGFLGWLADGSPVWAASRGASTELFRNWGTTLAPWLQRPAVADLGEACVDVRLFARYPLASVRDSRGQAVSPGKLLGDYRVDFVRGTSLAIRSDGELTLARVRGNLWLMGRFELNDYVARVLDREGAAEPPEAAKALAITARSYVLQNAGHSGGCLQIDDTTRTQRVAPRPPTAAALAIARWTDGLMLDGQPVQFHRDRQRPGVLGWQSAQLQAQQGARFTAILRAAFPQARLSSLYSPADNPCQPLPRGRTWLAQQQPRWRQLLAGEAGFEAPADVHVCRLDWGNPQVNLEQQQIFVRGLGTPEDRLSIAHEWLHLAFRYHPNGRDEVFIERWARRLAPLF